MRFQLEIFDRIEAAELKWNHMIDFVVAGTVGCDSVLPVDFAFHLRRNVSRTFLVYPGTNISCTVPSNASPSMTCGCDIVLSKAIRQTTAITPHPIPGRIMIASDCLAKGPGASTRRKYFGALLVGFYEGKKLKFAGRVGTGFSDKLLPTLIVSYTKFGLKSAPFITSPRPVGVGGTEGRPLRK
jgi:hypothetical protein